MAKWTCQAAICVCHTYQRHRSLLGCALFLQGRIMPTIDISNLEALEQQVSEVFGEWSNSVTITQDIIDRFAELTTDDQWIHTDPERAAKESPFGATVAHGFLVLSMMPAVRPPAAFELSGYSAAINYGASGLRFLAPVKAGEALHSRQRLTRVEQHKTGVLLHSEVQLAVVDAPKPSLVYHMQLLYRP